VIEIPLALIPNHLKKYFRPKRPSGAWTLRNVILWHKPNCMPSSARDRFTVDFEYVYFFTKGPKYYFEQQLEPRTDRNKSNIRQAEENPTKSRNKRCVWKIPSQPFPEAHFAVFPEKLVLTPIKAGCPKEVCIKCGKPKRQVKKLPKNPDAFNIRVRDVKKGRIKFIDRKASKLEISRYHEKEYGSGEREYVISEGCSCGAGFRPGIVLDPFMGAGTTAVVAKKLGRNFIGIDVSPKYIRLAEKRLESLSIKDGQK